MLRVGLTGGIACGKSTVVGQLQSRGVATLELDTVAHDVMAPGGAAYEAVVSSFGEGILAPEGIIDRQALGRVVFGDAEARARLDAIVHPRVREEEVRRAALFEEEGRELLVSDAALLVEAGVHLRFDRLVVVHCPAEEQRRRLMARDGIGEAAAASRIDSQMPIDEKRAFGHLEVDTSGSLEDTGAAADVLAGVLRTEARGPRPVGALVAGRALGGLHLAGARGPRGLAPRTTLAAIAVTGGLEMKTLAGRLEPAGSGPWYRAARPGEGAPWPEALAVPLAVWTIAKSLDQEWMCGAAASLARLTHGDGESIAGGVLAAIVAHEVVRAGDLQALADRSGEREARARRWGGAPPARRIHRALDAALARPDDPEGARALAESAGAEPGFAAGLVGLARGGRPEEADPGVGVLVERLVG